MRPQPLTSGRQEAESSRAARGVGGNPQKMPSWGQSRCGREDDGGQSWGPASGWFGWARAGVGGPLRGVGAGRYQLA